MRTSGVPDGGDMAMQVLVRGGRAWMNNGKRLESMPVPSGSGFKSGSTAAPPRSSSSRATSRTCA